MQGSFGYMKNSVEYIQGSLVYIQGSFVYIQGSFVYIQGSFDVRFCERLFIFAGRRDKRANDSQKINLWTAFEVDDSPASTPCARTLHDLTLSELDWGYVGLFGVYIRLFGVYKGLICMYIGLFWVYEGLICIDYSTTSTPCARMLGDMTLSFSKEPSIYS